MPAPLSRHIVVVEVVGNLTVPKLRVVKGRFLGPDAYFLAEYIEIEPSAFVRYRSVSSGERARHRTLIQILIDAFVKLGAVIQHRIGDGCAGRKVTLVRADRRECRGIVSGEKQLIQRVWIKTFVDSVAVRVSLYRSELVVKLDRYACEVNWLVKVGIAVEIVRPPLGEINRPVAV